MVDTFDLTVHLLSGDKVYYNLSRVAVKHYISYFTNERFAHGYSVELSRNSKLESLTSH